MRHRPPRPVARATIAMLTALAAATALGGCSGTARSSTSSVASEADTASSGFDGAALPAGERAPGFTLENQRGQRVSLSRYRGQVVVLSFLYPTCGRVCIVLAQQVRGALDELPHPVPVLFVSADPAGDSRAGVARFLAGVSLSGRVEYLSGSPAELRPIWREYRVTPPERDRAGFENTISLYLIDRSGDERVLFQLEELTPEALAHDIRKLGGD